jgi:hypothetical protein
VTQAIFMKRAVAKRVMPRHNEDDSECDSVRMTETGLRPPFLTCIVPMQQAHRLQLSNSTRAAGLPASRKRKARRACPLRAKRQA